MRATARKPGPPFPSPPDSHRLELLLRLHGTADAPSAGRSPATSYARYDNPTNAALEELMTVLESGHGALACASGMAAVESGRGHRGCRPAQVPVWQPDAL